MMFARSWAFSIICIAHFFSLVHAQSYDNEPCNNDLDCLGDRCDSSDTCSQSLRLTYEDVPEETSYFRSASFLSTISAENGGVVVNPNESISLYGRVRSIYQLDSSMMLDKFSTLQFDLSEVSSAAGKGFCFYRQPVDTTNFDDVDNVRCIVIGSSPLSQLSNVESIEGSKERLGGAKTNFCIGKSATQSSTYSSGKAENAIDGDTTAEFNFDYPDLNTVTSTTSEFEPWWQVDLMSTYKIEEIKIFKRMDGYSGRLLDFNLEIFAENGSVVWKRTLDDTNDESVLTYPIDGVSGKIVKISLNGEVKRILSLADVQVFGDSFEFNFDLGREFNIPRTNVNRIAFIQDDDGDGKQGQSKFSRITFMKNEVKEISEIAWEEAVGSDSTYIQGTSTVTRSPSGVYIALRNPEDVNEIIFYYEGGLSTFPDPFEVRGIALSDNGFAICSFESLSGETAVRVLRVGAVVVVTESKIGVEGMGRGISITPDATKVAIGDTRTEKVYIFDLRLGRMDQSDASKRTINAPAEIMNADFGEKIGFSVSGSSLAVAAPNYKRDGKAIGVVAVYVFEDDEWNSIGSYVYGMETNLMIGQGGVTVDEVAGRVDANDISGERTSFQYKVVCSDSNAIPEGQNSNAFNPNCKCGENLKSSNELGGKRLRNKRDVCIPCVGKADCREGPAVPTPAPTTVAPTGRPSVISPAPSNTVTEARDPTRNPTLSPTAPANSLFDGDRCTFDAECIESVCASNGRCKPGAMLITEKAPVSNEETLVTGELIPEGAASQGGNGVIVKPANTITLHGKVSKTYTLSKAILISKNTQLAFKIKDRGQAQEVSFCLYQRSDIDVKDDRCVNVDVTEESFVNAAYGKDGFGGTTFVKYMRFVQTSGKSEFSDIEISANDGEIICGGECCDPNAIREDNDCYCKDGYVAVDFSTGRQGRQVNEKKLTATNSCLDCRDAEDQCGLDGDKCTTGASCWFGTCEAGKCKAGNFEIQRPGGNDLTATLIGNFNETTVDTGGVIATNGKLYLHGNAEKIYELSASHTVNKYSYLTFSFERNEDEELNLGSSTDSKVEVCLYEKRNGDVERLQQEGQAEKRCGEVTPGPNSDSSTYRIDFGSEFFNSRSSEVKYISLKQEVLVFGSSRHVEVRFDNFVFLEESRQPQVNNRDRCVDPHANEIPEPSGVCRCKDGYISSNGGMELDEVSSCVQCIQPYGYDGDLCHVNRGCFRGDCNFDSNTCSAESLRIRFRDNDESLDLETKWSTGGGGVVVSDDSIDFYGDTSKVYKVTGNIPVDQFTELSVEGVEYDEAVASTLKICLYDSPDPLKCELKCIDLPSQSKKVSPRSAQLTYVKIIHETGDNSTKTSIKSLIELERGEAKDSYDTAARRCRDKNARDASGRNKQNGGKCVCTDGYLSSNTGQKLLDDKDSCISCIGNGKCSRYQQTNTTCAETLLVSARLGGLLSQPLQINAKLLETGFNDELHDGGGSEVRVLVTQREDGQTDTVAGVALFGAISKTYELETPYTINRFSRLYMFLSAVKAKDFLAMCLSTELNPSSSNSTSVRCISLPSGDPSEKVQDTSKFPSGWEYPTSPFNLALKKPTLQSQSDTGFDSSFAVDGDLTEMKDDEEDEGYNVTKTLLQAFPYWEVNLEAEFNIRQIVIHFSKDKTVDFNSEYNVDILSDSGALVYRKTIDKRDRIDAAFSEEIDIETVRSGMVDEKFVNFKNIRGSRVRITLIGEARILSLREVQVYETAYVNTGSTLIDLPIGRLNDGMEVNYISFVQMTNSRMEPSLIFDMNFVYGSALEATPAPTQTASPSETSSPSLSSSPSAVPSTSGNGTAVPSSSGNETDSEER